MNDSLNDSLGVSDPSGGVDPSGAIPSQVIHQE